MQGGSTYESSYNCIYLRTFHMESVVGLGVKSPVNEWSSLFHEYAKVP